MIKTVKKNTNAYKALIVKLQSGQYQATRYTLDNGFTGETFTNEEKQRWTKSNIQEDIKHADVRLNESTGTITIRFHSNSWIEVT